MLPFFFLYIELIWPLRISCKAGDPLTDDREFILDNDLHEIIPVHFDLVSIKQGNSVYESHPA